MINSNLNLIKQLGRINNITKISTGDKNTIDILVLKEKLSLKFEEDVDLASQKKRILQKIELLKSKFLD